MTVKEFFDSMLESDLFFSMLLLAVAIIIATPFIIELRSNRKNSKNPIETLSVKILKIEKQGFVGKMAGRHTVTAEFSSGERKILYADGPVVALLVVGEKKTLTMQGARIVGFENDDQNAKSESKDRAKKKNVIRALVILLLVIASINACISIVNFYQTERMRCDRCGLIRDRHVAGVRNGEEFDVCESCFYTYYFH